MTGTLDSKLDVNTNILQLFVCVAEMERWKGPEQRSGKDFGDRSGVLVKILKIFDYHVLLHTPWQSAAVCRQFQFELATQQN